MVFTIHVFYKKSLLTYPDIQFTPQVLEGFHFNNLQVQHFNTFNSKQKDRYYIKVSSSCFYMGVDTWLLNERYKRQMVCQNSNCSLKTQKYRQKAVKLRSSIIVDEQDVIFLVQKILQMTSHKNPPHELHVSSTMIKGRFYIHDLPEGSNGSLASITGCSLQRYTKTCGGVEQSSMD